MKEAQFINRVLTTSRTNLTRFRTKTATFLPLASTVPIALDYLLSLKVALESLTMPYREV